MDLLFAALDRMILVNDFFVRREVLELLPVPLCLIGANGDVAWRNEAARLLQIGDRQREEILHAIAQSIAPLTFDQVRLTNQMRASLKAMPIKNLAGDIIFHLAWLADMMPVAVLQVMDTGLAVASQGQIQWANAKACEALHITEFPASWNKIAWLPSWTVLQERGPHAYLTADYAEWSIRIHENYGYGVLEMVPNIIAAPDQISSTFAAALMHEIRNPLAALSGYIELSLLRIDQAAEVKEYLMQAMAEIDRVSRLTQDMLWISRSWNSQPAWVELAALIERAWSIAIAVKAGDQDVSLCSRVDPDLRVWADSDRLLQAL
ncbi:MAG: HAMP domain-containing sensor histidine kinase, partial [Firmicutes bacterium]|nr:HAMP domain-containing sensor histidine kinase [Bacillota bacterium]